MLKAAETICASYSESRVNEEHVIEAAELTIPHRTRRLPIKEMAQSLDEVLGQ